MHSNFIDELVESLLITPVFRQIAASLPIILYPGKSSTSYRRYDVIAYPILLFLTICNSGCSISSVLVLIGITICSRIAALTAFLGSAIGAGVAALVGVPAVTIEQGLLGFNPSLTMSAMLMFYVPSIYSVLVGIIASVITVFIQLALSSCLEPYGLPSMVRYSFLSLVR